MATDTKTRELPMSTRTVTVMCKIPSGLVLQLQEKVKRPVSGRYGTEVQEFSEFRGRRYYVRGPSYPVAPPKGYPKMPVIEGGYAATSGIPADFWSKWWEQNKHTSYCQAPDGADRGCIFAEADLESAVSAAREHEKLLSGLEPLSTDVDKDGRMVDPRAPRPLSSNMTPLAQDSPPSATSITQAA